MTTEQIEQIEGGNRLIAAFLGVQCIKYEINHFESSYRMADVSGNYFEGFWAYTTQQLAEDDFYKNAKYHTSWEWLMPVVERIESMGTIVEISLCLGRMCRIIKGSFKQPTITISNQESNSTIEAVWLAVVDFIKWHNQQNLNNG
jgi:hypothetical protein